MDGILLWILFVIAALYVALNIGDVALRLSAAVRRGGHKQRAIEKAELDEKPERLAAIIMPAWDEADILKSAVENLFDSMQYSPSMFHLFIGVHTNDEETLHAATRLMRENPNIHVVIEGKAGPTSKASVINNIVRFIKCYERQNERRFAFAVIHDVKDVPHPYELKFANHLIDKYDMLQFPVCPVQELPRFGNIFSNFTSGTFVDRLADKHCELEAANLKKSGIVASIGTGVAFSARALDLCGEGDMLSNGGLFDNYVYAARLNKAGLLSHYVTERAQRLDNSGRLVLEQVSVRIIFPTRFSDAVAKRARWRRERRATAPSFSEIFSLGGGACGRHTLFCAFMRGFINVLAIPAYAAYVYFLVSLVFVLPVEFAVFSLGWWTTLVMSVLIIAGQALRFTYVKSLYGARSAAIACLLPPLVPARFIYGAFILFCAELFSPARGDAAARALSASHGDAASAEGAGQTHSLGAGHDYLDKSVLNRYYRNLGDVLLEKDYVNPETLRWALDVSKDQDRLVGEVLLHGKKISEEHLMRALASVKHTLFLPELRGFVCKEYAADWEQEALEACIAFPVLKTNDFCVMALADESPQSARFTLELRSGRSVHVVYSTRDAIRDAIAAMYSPTFRGIWSDSQVYKLFMEGSITWEQAILTRVYQSTSMQSSEELLKLMGLKQ